MPIHVEKQPVEPIIVANFTEPVDYYSEIAGMFARILELRDTIQGGHKYYVIVDLCGLKPNFNEIVYSLSEARRASMKRRPDLLVSLHLVGSGTLFEMVANALSQRQYGGYAAPLHLTAAQALEAIHAEIAASRSAA